MEVQNISKHLRNSCFYIQNGESVRGKDEIALASDPPPDLIIEIDITSESLDRFPLFAAVGVMEVWRFDRTSVAFFRLEDDEYRKTLNSLAFPSLTSEIATRFLTESLTMKSTQWLRRVRQWARAVSKG